MWNIKIKQDFLTELWRRQRDDGKDIHNGQHFPLESQAGAELPAGPAPLPSPGRGGRGRSPGTGPVVEDGELGTGLVVEG